MKIRGVLVVLSAVVLASTAECAVGIWKNYTSMKEVRGLTHTGTAYWAATSGGLFRWNSADDSYLRITNADGLQSTDLTAVGVDRSGNVWTGSSSGLIQVCSQDGQGWRYVLDFVANRDLTNKRVNSFTILGDSILVCTEFGLSVFRISTFGFGDTYKQFASLRGNVRVAVSAAVVFNDSLWISVTDGNISRVAVASLSTPNLLPPESWNLLVVGNSATSINQLAVFNNSLYAGTSSGVYVYTAGAWVSLVSFAGRSVTSLSASPSFLDIVTSSDAFTLDAQGAVQHVGSSLPFPAQSGTSDPVGMPVVASIGGGILTFSTADSAWHFHVPNGPNSNFFFNVAIGPDGSVWSGTGTSGHGTGVNRFDGRIWKSYTAQNSGLPTNDSYLVSVGCDGSLWLSTWGWGVVEFPQGVERADSAHVFGRNVGMVGVPENLDYVVITTVVCDGNGNHWMSIDRAADGKILAVRKADGTWATMPIKVASGSISTMVDNLPDDRSFAVDADNNLWGAARSGNLQGVFSLNNGGAIDDSADYFLTAADGLPSNVITTVVVDHDNTVWVGTDQGIGIILYPNQPKSAGAIATYIPLSGAVINCIAVDALNQKWVGTTEGVVVLSPDGTQQVATYTVASTSGKLIDNNVKSIAIDHTNGTVFFGTLSGLASLQTFSITPRLSFQELKIRPKLFLVPSDSLMTIGSLDESTHALAGLFPNWTVKILSIDGRLVREIKASNESIARWDGTDNTGHFVASGVYIVVAFSEDGSSVAKGKMAVIRR